MSKKKEWRKRVRGTPRQIGQTFPLTERADKRKLPTDMKQVAYSERTLEDEQRKQVEEDMEVLYKEVEHAIRVKDYEIALELAKGYKELSLTLEQPEIVELGRKERFNRWLEKIGFKLDELYTKGRKAVKEAERRLDDYGKEEE